MKNSEPRRFVINQAELPEGYPTHAHHVHFWECLGRTVATFGFLEEVLTRAIFAVTATTEYDESEIQVAFAEWISKLERSLSDQLGGLIDTYGKAVRENSASTIENLDDLLGDLRKAAKIRNVLCHGSWRVPDANGTSIPFFVNRQGERFETPVDVAFLNQVQKHALGLSCSVINSVTHMGWQFPGSGGPGKVIFG